MIAINLQDRMKNLDTRKRTNVRDVGEHIARLKWMEDGLRE